MTDERRMMKWVLFPLLRLIQSQRSTALLVLLSGLTALVLLPLPQSNAAPSSEDLGENELIWAGLSGNPPRFIDSGDEKGLGYIEIQTKLIRKAIAEAGFRIRYEYFSSARIAHEFSRKVPICLYPVEWKDPQKTFASPPDRIYSIPLDFRGEVGASIVIRKADLAKYQKYIDSKGLLSLSALLKDSSFKTLLPKTEGLGREFQDVYRMSPDGSIEITEPFKNHISTRVIRDNHQLIQMLDGNRFDYLLNMFVIEDDYKSIRGGKTPFVSIPYSQGSFQTIADPQVNLISVACSINQTSERVMPIVNATIRALRGPAWTARQNALQRHFEGGTSWFSYHDLAYRFSAEIAAGKADAWYPVQMRHFPNLKQFVVPQTPPESNPVENAGAASTSSLQKGPTASHPIKQELTWLLIAPSPNSLWLLPKADAVLLSNLQQPAFQFESLWQGPIRLNELLKAWSPAQLEALRTKVDHPDREGPYSQLLEVVLRQSTSLKSFSLVARTLRPEDLQKIEPLLKGGALTRFELISANAKPLKELLPVIPPTLEHLNLWGSNLREVRLAPLLRRLPDLKSLNLSATAIDRKDLEDSFLALGSEIVDLRAGYQVLAWSEELARAFGKKSFPRLEVLDLEHNALDDRHCGLFQAAPATLKVLKLNGNTLTSNCLQPLLSRPMARLQTLELAFLRVSTKPEFRLKIPPSVQHLDLSYVADDPSTLSRIDLPNRLKSLSLANNAIPSGLFASIAKHLEPQLDLLNLSDPTWLGANGPSMPTGIGFTLFKDLKAAGVLSIKDLRLANINFSGWQAGNQDLMPLGVEDVDLKNTVLSNQALYEIAASWGSALKRINLSQNLISTPSILRLLEKSPELTSIDLSDLPDLDVPQIAPHFSQRLKALNLANSGITDRDLERLLPNLPDTLTSLNFSGSFFGTRGAKVLGEYLKIKAPILNSLSLNTPLQEMGWKSILPNLPSNLFFLTFGPATLGPEASGAFLSGLPRSLRELHLRSDRITITGLSELTESLPLGLDRLNFDGSTDLVGLSSQINQASRYASWASWPASLRTLRLYSQLTREALQAVGLSVFPSAVNFWILDAGVTELVFPRLLSQAADPFLVEVGEVRVGADVIRAINTTQPLYISFRNSSVEKGKLQELDSRALKHLKGLAMVGTKFQSADLFELMKKMPPNMGGLQLTGTRLTFADMPQFIKALPPGLHLLLVGGTEIGPEGYKLLQDYAKQVEKRTGMKMRIVY